jgi:ribA/ribD-fused uncharacterized protein
MFVFQHTIGTLFWFKKPMQIMISNTFIYPLQSIRHMDRNWFSNFLPYKVPLQYEGETFATPEHFYQAMKVFDPENFQRVARAATPRKAKNLGRELKDRLDWEYAKIPAMRHAQEHRIETDPNFTRQLQETGLFEIVEWNTWCDNYWGHCTCEDCQELPKLNNLGKILMQLREKLSSNLNG